MENVISQGDVQLVPCKIPEGALPVPPDDRGGVLLAGGSAKGHSHRFSRGAQEFTLDGKRYVRLEKDAKLEHEQHGHIESEFTTAEYEIVGQQKFNYSTQLRERVQD